MRLWQQSMVAFEADIPEQWYCAWLGRALVPPRCLFPLWNVWLVTRSWFCIEKTTRKKSPKRFVEENATKRILHTSAKTSELFSRLSFPTNHTNGHKRLVCHIVALCSIVLSSVSTDCDDHEKCQLSPLCLLGDHHLPQEKAVHAGLLLTLALHSNLQWAATY